MPERNRVVFAVVGSAPIPGLDPVSALVKTQIAKHLAAEKSKRRGERRTRTISSGNGLRSAGTRSPRLTRCDYRHH
jgi:hypothetical protein